MVDKAVRGWLNTVDDDLGAVRACLNAVPPIIPVATYHCQQAAEKLVKAVLVSVGKHPPKSHNIMALVDDIPVDHPLLPMLRPLERFTPFVAAFRYPGATPLEAPAVPDPAEVASWLAEITVVRADVERLIAGSA